MRFDKSAELLLESSAQIEKIKKNMQQIRLDTFIIYSQREIHIDCIVTMSSKAEDD